MLIEEVIIGDDAVIEADGNGSYSPPLEDRLWLIAAASPILADK
jgi:hypothetical protein